MKKHLLWILLPLSFLLVSAGRLEKVAVVPQYTENYFNYATYATDFYTAVNKEWMLENRDVLKEDKSISNNIIIEENVNEKLKSLIKNLEKKENKTRKEQVIYDYYLSGIDIETRNQLGITPIKEYLEKYQNVKSLEELLDLEKTLYKNLGFFTLFDFSYTGFAPSFSCAFPFAGKSTENLLIQKLYQKELKKLLILAGFEESQVAKIAETSVNFEAELAKSSLTESEKINPLNATNYDFYAVKKLFTEFDFEIFCNEAGVSRFLGQFFIEDFGLIKKSASYYTNENLETLKCYAISRLIIKSAPFLSEEFVVQYNNLINLSSNNTLAVTPEYLEQTVIKNIKETLTCYLEEMFVEHFVTQETKEKVTLLAKDIIATYEKMLSNNTILSEKGIKVTTQKLKALKLHIAYPEKIPDQFEDLKGLNPKSYLTNYYITYRDSVNWKYENFGWTKDDSNWTKPVYEINAYYLPVPASLCIYGGYLQEPNYSEDFTYEQLLGTIGRVIGHEISHGFDKNNIGINFYGRSTPVWDEESYVKYQEWSKKIEDLYEGYLDFGGVKNKGAQCVSENIADIVGLQVCLDLLKTKENPNYKEFFEAYASVEKGVYKKSDLSWWVGSDTHATPRARVNCVVANFQEFYDTYGITNEDPMYIKPEDRVRF